MESIVRPDANIRERICAATFLTAIFVVVATATAPPFRDISRSAGLLWNKGPKLKYGGACVADLNADGWPDLMFSHHGRTRLEIYLNRRDGTFKRSPWSLLSDVHAMTPVRINATATTMHAVLSRGGGNGNNPHAPIVLAISSEGTVTQLSDSLGLERSKGRGRSSLPIALQPFKVPGHHLIVANLHSPAVVFKADADYFSEVNLQGYNALKNSNPAYMIAVGLRTPYQQDIVTWPSLKAFRVYPSKIVDVTSEVFPNKFNFRAVTAVSEFDFDNDGHLDLYVSRGTEGDNSYLRWPQGQPIIRDSLLRNNGNGKYTDVSLNSGIPKLVQSHGVTVGDFDNDGWMDVIISVYSGRDLYLQNLKNGTFQTFKAPWSKVGNAVGDMVTAVDFNRDGRLDIVVSEGAWTDDNHPGYYRLLKNNLSDNRKSQFILVRVGHSPFKKATSLHAIIKVRTKNGIMIRKVGSPGTAVCNSWIELVHFGIGHSGHVTSVSVRWTDGAIITKQNVRIGFPTPILFGLFS